MSREINPELAHYQGDMRTVRLGRQFDAVFVHDAICYMTTEPDLRRAIETAFDHCKPGGVALFCPDYVAETSRPALMTAAKMPAGAGCGGSNGGGIPTRTTLRIGSTMRTYCATLMARLTSSTIGMSKGCSRARSGLDCFERLDSSRARSRWSCQISNRANTRCLSASGARTQRRQASFRRMKHFR